ncbi:NCS1 family nucleobase:cation symporter-1 [Roseibium sp. MMSF_3412]|uniref:NCS1 family nucleobase:cation symporter-1 n=1 Tax=Roseibium sp. MMSF_3412 TaxID=3046712 RepID=UPI00273F2659|nr:NCS1 family nucleobase:cation symporter-1 [Roseibium sp. MMSF_3412]
MRSESETDLRLYNKDLAPVAVSSRSWGWFAIFNTWCNASQSLLGYTLAASFFFSYGLNGWAVFAAIVLSGFVIMMLINLAGEPSVRYGIPYPVLARASMGVYGANIPALMRGIVAIFWYGAQSYVGSTAVLLMLTVYFGEGSKETFLGLTPLAWLALGLVCVLQVALFWKGIEWIRVFLNWAGPAVYAVMVTLLVMIWVKTGTSLPEQVGIVLKGHKQTIGAQISDFFAVVGTMIAFYAAIILNYGDFSRYVHTQRDMRLGNLLGLPVNITLFALLSLLISAGTIALFGEHLTDPTAIIARIDNDVLTIVASLTFFVATVGINVVANYVPPANDLSNLWPARISFRRGGIIAAAAAFCVSAAWVPFISVFGISKFVNTLGAFLAPAYGIMVADYYLVKKRTLVVKDLYDGARTGAYHFQNGFNLVAIAALFVSSIFSVSAVWLPSLEILKGFDWLISAGIGAAMYLVMIKVFSGALDPRNRQKQ